MKKTCLNCGKEFESNFNFCPYCGQANKKNNLSLKYIVSEFLSVNFNVDSKLFLSLKLLLLRPAFLTREYLAGKHTKYLSPVRIYLLVSLVYFFLLSICPDNQDSIIKFENESNNVSTVDAIALSSKKHSANIKQKIDDTNTLSLREERLVKKLNKMKTKQGQQEFWQHVRKNFSTGLLLLMPLTALILYMIFYKSSYYFEHLVFIIHLQTVWFIVSGIYILLKLMIPGIWLFYTEVVLLLLLTFFWFRNFYKRSIVTTLWKMTLFFSAFSFLFLIFFIIIALLSLLIV